MLPKASETSPTPLPAAADDARADFTLGPWLVQPSLQRMVREDCEKTLGPTVLGVLLALAHRPLEAVSKDELIAGAWLGDAASDEALTTAVYELRKALGDDARSPRFIATIRGRGYRLLIRPGAAAPERSDLPLPGAPSTPQKAAQQESPPANLPPEDFLPSPSEPPSARASRRLGEMAGGLIAALVAVLLALPSVLSAPPAERETGAPRADSPLPRASAADLPSPANAEFPAPIVIHPGRDASARRSVAVLPLESRGEHQPADFARGLTERVAIDLSRSEWLDVVPSFSRTFEASVTSGAVDAVVEGAVRRHGDRVTVTVQLISITDGQLLWGGTWERPLGDAAALESRLASEIARRVRARLGAQAVVALRPEVDEAMRLGQHFLDGDAPGRARRFFTFAIESAPALASAHAGLAATYLAEAEAMPLGERSTAVDEARRSAALALEIDAEQPRAHASAAAIAFLHDGDLARAADHFERAGLTLGAPASSVRRYSAFLSAAGRHDEAISWLEDAVHRAPASVESRLDLARALYLARRYEPALAELAILRELAPFDPRPLRLESNVLLLRGDLAAAVEACRRALELAGGPQDIARALETAFEETGLEGVLHCLHDASRADDGLEGWVDPMQLARFEAVRGNVPEALERLAQARNEGSMQWVWLGVDPAFEDLHEEAGFRELQRQI